MTKVFTITPSVGVRKPNRSSSGLNVTSNNRPFMQMDEYLYCNRESYYSSCNYYEDKSEVSNLLVN